MALLLGRSFERKQQYSSNKVMKNIFRRLKEYENGIDLSLLPPYQTANFVTKCGEMHQILIAGLSRPIRLITRYNDKIGQRKCIQNRYIGFGIRVGWLGCAA